MLNKNFEENTFSKAFFFQLEGINSSASIAQPGNCTQQQYTVYSK
jgi:hypothetical protein